MGKNWSTERHRTLNLCSQEELTGSSQVFGHGPSTTLHWKEEETSVSGVHLRGCKCMLGCVCLYVASGVRYVSICIQCVCVTGRLMCGVYVVRSMCGMRYIHSMCRCLSVYVQCAMDMKVSCIQMHTDCLVCGGSVCGVSVYISRVAHLGSANCMWRICLW